MTAGELDEMEREARAEGFRYLSEYARTRLRQARRLRPEIRREEGLHFIVPPSLPESPAPAGKRGGRQRTTGSVAD